MPSKHDKQIRDFIYLDTARLESILAQAQRGLVKEIVETGGRETGLEGELSGGLPWLQARISAKGGASSEHQVSKILHDYLCSQVEAVLDKQIVGLDKFKSEDWQSKRVHQELSRTQSDFIRITGQVKIVDFMGQALQIESLGKINEIMQKLGASKQKDQARTRQQVTGFAELVRQSYSDLIILKVFPLLGNNRFHLTGALEKDSLQEDRAHLLLKYGVHPTASWTVLAQVAAVPMTEQPASTLRNTPPDFGSLISGQFTDMADVIEKVLDATSQTLAAAGMTITVKHPAIAITPLAIYRV